MLERSDGADVNEMRALLAVPRRREALKALLTEDGPVEVALDAFSSDRRKRMADALAAAVDALDSPKEDA